MVKNQIGFSSRNVTSRYSNIKHES